MVWCRWRDTRPILTKPNLEWTEFKKFNDRPFKNQMHLTKSDCFALYCFYAITVMHSCFLVEAQKGERHTSLNFSTAKLRSSAGGHEMKQKKNQAWFSYRLHLRKCRNGLLPLAFALILVTTPILSASLRFLLHHHGMLRHVGLLPCVRLLRGVCKLG